MSIVFLFKGFSINFKRKTSKYIFVWGLKNFYKTLEIFVKVTLEPLFLRRIRLETFSGFERSPPPDRHETINWLVYFFMISYTWLCLGSTNLTITRFLLRILTENIDMKNNSELSLYFDCKFSGLNRARNRVIIEISDHSLCQTTSVTRQGFPLSLNPSNLDKSAPNPI